MWEGNGGHAAYPSDVQAVVDGYGPADLLHMDADSLPGGVVNDIDPSSPPWGLLGGPTTEHPEPASQASPVSHVSGPTAPFLILHGDADLLVGPRQSERLFDALHGAGERSDPGVGPRGRTRLLQHRRTRAHAASGHDRAHHAVR